MTDNRTELEVLLLMEYCTCSLLDALNQDRIKSEARLHANNPPISHRDLKVENVLLGEDGTWKLCDFGSATTATYLPTTERERSVAEEDINRNTTMMYRAPEMVDLYRRQPINEKVDIWALGCVLFKMAYMVDAFDGGLGILNARYTFPEYRRSTPSFEEFIAFMLNPDPTARPNIQQVQERLATLRGVPVSKQPTPNPTQRQLTSNSAQKSPTARHTPNGNTNVRPSSAPSQKPVVADLVDWGDAPAKPQAAQQHAQIHNSAPQQLHNSTPPPPSAQAKSANSSSSLFDVLDWHTPTPNSSSPTPTTQAPSLKSTPQAAPIQQRAHSNNSSPVSRQPTKSNIPPSNPRSDIPDLLDFSTPAPKPATPPTHMTQFAVPPTATPTATPTGYYSPQPHRPAYAMGGGPPSYYSPPFPSAHPNRPIQQDPLAQFALPKQQSSSSLDDFDPLAKKSTQPPSSPSPSPSTSHTPSLLPMPQQGHRSRSAPHSDSNDTSLINF